MLEAQEKPSSPATATQLSVMGSPTTADQIDASWNALLDTVNMLKVPAGEPRRTALYKAYDSWYARFWETPRADVLKPFVIPSAELPSWAAAFNQQKIIGQQLASEYGQKAATSAPPVQGGTLGPMTVTGDVPWWYWPLRIGAGIAAGWGIYRLLRPTKIVNYEGFSFDVPHQPHPGPSTPSWWKPSKGLGADLLHNREGLTYEEWLNAAHKNDEYYGYSSRYRNKLRMAWSKGEDPTEWRFDPS